ncbi:OLC1v1013778C1 [Oldenlandia corymbosa var. corymbosa]|uniref:OLC1v1013778C1 n=1 Tax=Oldenlandia corymbosa var. corymbosa TaxID=529605 RepID=A0AAV1E2N4_OLDCO|nr:OLC1v1013778C1 [Oldenlandia corymbosa var. corymbosa]
MVISGLDLSPPRRRKVNEVPAQNQQGKFGLITGKELKEEITKAKKEELQRFKELDPSISGRGAEPVYRDKLTAEARLKELESEKHKPFSRSLDDPELDKILRERIRSGDPMAPYLGKKNQKEEPILEDLGDHEKMKESGFIIPQGIPGFSWLRRGGICPPQKRYGIRPGRHWNGVDRSTGFDKRMIQA